MRADQIPDVDLSKALSAYVDIHNHGAMGHDVNSATAEELLEAAAFLWQKGVSGWLPTLVPDSDENYEQIVAEIDRLMDVQRGRPVAQALGVHYEGVFANTGMCGALRPQYFKTFTGSEVDALPRLTRGIHMITLAPEIDGGIAAIERLVETGWLVSIGHTQADVPVLEHAFAAGARHMTHFFNAMSGLHHRDLGAVGWGLSKSGVTIDIISDGIHVHPEMIKLACRIKGVENISLISDSVAPTGLGDGSFDLWGEKIEVGNGRTCNDRGSIAGSVATLADCADNMLKFGFSRDEVRRMASINPARLLSL